MPRYCRDTPNGKWLHDNGKEWRAILSSYVSKSISSFASLAKKQHITKITKILNKIKNDNIHTYFLDIPYCLCMDFGSNRASLQVAP